MDVNVGVLLFSAIVNIALAAAMVLMTKDFTSKLVTGLQNKSNLAGAVMGAVINPDGSDNGRYQRDNGHRVDYPTQRPAATESR